MSDFYEILNINKNASESEIKAAYKKLALKYHPDKCKPEEREENEIKFKTIKNAYESLLNKNKDLDGFPTGFSHGFSSGFPPNFFSMFEQQQQQQQQQQVFNITVYVPLTLKDVYTGVIKNVNYNKTEKCVTCDSKGYINKEDINYCSYCNGTGYIDQIIDMGFIRQIIKSNCNHCKSQGTIILKPCTSCNGNKIISKDVDIKIKFSRGIKNGDSIILKNKGNYYNNCITDLIVIAQILPHDSYTRINNNDLFITLDVSLIDALKGFTKTLKFIDDSEFEFKSTSILNPSSIVKISDKGIVKKGELIIKFNIIFPTNLQDFINEITI